MEGIYHNTHPHDCVDLNPLGNGDVGVIIFDSYVHSNVHPTQRFLLHRWALSLHDYKRQHMQIQNEFQAYMRPQKRPMKI